MPPKHTPTRRITERSGIEVSSSTKQEPRPSHKSSSSSLDNDKQGPDHPSSSHLEPDDTGEKVSIPSAKGRQRLEPAPPDYEYVLVEASPDSYSVLNSEVDHDSNVSSICVTKPSPTLKGCESRVRGTPEIEESPVFPIGRSNEQLQSSSILPCAPPYSTTNPHTRSDVAYITDPSVDASLSGSASPTPLAQNSQAPPPASPPSTRVSHNEMALVPYCPPIPSSIDSGRGQVQGYTAKRQLSHQGMRVHSTHQSRPSGIQTSGWFPAGLGTNTHHHSLNPNRPQETFTHPIFLREFGPATRHPTLNPTPSPPESREEGNLWCHTKSVGHTITISSTNTGPLSAYVSSFHLQPSSPSHQRSSTLRPTTRPSLTVPSSTPQLSVFHASVAYSATAPSGAAHSCAPQSSPQEPSTPQSSISQSSSPQSFNTQPSVAQSSATQSTARKTSPPKQTPLKSFKRRKLSVEHAPEPQPSVCSASPPAFTNVQTEEGESAQKFRPKHASPPPTDVNRCQRKVSFGGESSKLYNDSDPPCRVQRATCTTSRRVCRAVIEVEYCATGWRWGCVEREGEGACLQRKVVHDF
jgi:hypothetical protein